MKALFDPVTHTYRDESGVEYPSVTTIIKEIWPVSTRYYTDEGRDWGTEVHEATAMIDQGLIELEDLDGPLRLACHSWTTFRDRLECEIVAVEESFLHPLLSYAGTADRLVRMPGQDGTEMTVLLDLKTGRPEKWHELQLGAYAVGLQKHLIVDIQAAMTVHIPKEGAARSIGVNVEAGASAWKALRRWQLYRETFR